MRGAIQQQAEKGGHPQAAGKEQNKDKPSLNSDIVHTVGKALPCPFPTGKCMVLGRPRKARRSTSAGLRHTTKQTGDPADGLMKHVCWVDVCECIPRFIRMCARWC